MGKNLVGTGSSLIGSTEYGSSDSFNEVIDYYELIRSIKECKTQISYVLDKRNDNMIFYLWPNTYYTELVATYGRLQKLEAFIKRGQINNRIFNVRQNKSNKEGIGIRSWYRTVMGWGRRLLGL